VAQNVYNNKNLQGEFSDPDSPYYQGDGTGTDENGNPVGNCSEINAGCTADQEEIEDYIGDEIIVIGSSGESLYYYHPDHLGSASVITDGSGNLREHIEYFAFGETWVQEGASKKTPFMYTGKELDQETGLYYYGARYYDPRTSVWQSVDPILEKYLPSGDPEKDKNLPGMGGFFNSGNLAGYTYTHQNPVRYVDPDGNRTVWESLDAASNVAVATGMGGVMFPEPGTTAAGGIVAAAGLIGKGVAKLGPKAEKGLKLLSKSKSYGFLANKFGENAKHSKNLLNAIPTGQALKSDKYHRAASFMSGDAAKYGTHYSHKSGDGTQGVLTQLKGEIDGVQGVFEYLVKGDELVHQLFKPGRNVDGFIGNAGKALD